MNPLSHLPLHIRAQAGVPASNGLPVVFKAGAGAAKGTPMMPVDGPIIFEDATGAEALRIETGGQFYIRGVLADTDPAIYTAFRGWLMRATVNHSPTGLEVAP